MREILFRGKRKYGNGEWVEGLLWKKKCKTEKLLISCFPDEDDNEELFVISPETVGQYTGLTDKNGKKIWEGDIVKGNAYTYYDRNIKTKTSDGILRCAQTLRYHIYVVKMDETRGGWFPFACGDGCGCCENDVMSAEDSEVIGNIHDNPELMEEKV